MLPPLKRAADLLPVIPAQLCQEWLVFYIQILWLDGEGDNKTKIRQSHVGTLAIRRQGHVH
jgi:hypothetical protein